MTARHTPLVVAGLPLIKDYSVLRTYPDGSRLVELTCIAPYDRGDGVMQTTDRWHLAPDVDVNEEVLRYEANTKTRIVPPQETTVSVSIKRD